MERSYNTRCPAVKRLLKEAQELHKPTEEYFAQPLEDNLFEWHFTLRGPVNTDFEEGIYHGRIILPSEYPMKPPDIIFLTQNGRFETNKKICLSISGYHPESWRPSWSIRTALLAIIGYMPSSGLGTIAGLQYTSQERQILAKKSQGHVCEVCGSTADVLLPRTSHKAHEISQEAEEISREMSMTEKPLSEGPIKTSANNTASMAASSTPTLAASTPATTSSSSPASATAASSSSPTSVQPFTRVPNISDTESTAATSNELSRRITEAEVSNHSSSSEVVAANVNSAVIPTAVQEVDINPPELMQRVGALTSATSGNIEPDGNAASAVTAPISGNAKVSGSAASAANSASPVPAGISAPATRATPAAAHSSQRAAATYSPSEGRESMFNVFISTLLVLSISLLTILVMRRVIIVASGSEDSDDFFPIDHEEFFYNT